MWDTWVPNVRYLIYHEIKWVPNVGYLIFIKKLNNFPPAQQLINFMFSYNIRT